MRVWAVVPLESETPSTESPSSAVSWAEFGCWMPAMAATRDCERKPNEAGELVLLLSSFALPLLLPVAPSGVPLPVATVALSWASAWD